MKTVDPKKLAEFLAEARTAADIAANLGAEGLGSADIHALPLPEGIRLFEQKNNLGESIFKALAQPAVPKLKPRAFSFWQNPEQPYLWVQFPPDLGLSRIKIVPLSDIHYGAKAHNKTRFVKLLKYIEENDDVYAFLNGDITENALASSVGGAVYESKITPDEQLWGTEDGSEEGIIELLRPIAHKLLWAQPGNHEWRTWKAAKLDPTRIICRELGIPYFSEPVYIDVLAWGRRFTFFCHHGASGSNTKGGKLNAAMKPVEFQEALHFVVMGHVHDAMANAIKRFVRKREYDENGAIVGFRLEEFTEHIVVCGSFYEFFSTYAARAGYTPGAWGTITCTLFKDGNYRASK